MKVAELMESSYSGRPIWRHHGSRGYGLRAEVTKPQRDAVVNAIIDRLARANENTKDQYWAKGVTAVWSSPEMATTFPADIRVVIHGSDERSDPETMAGQMMPRLAKAVIKKAFSDVLGFDVSVAVEEDHNANGLRYIDTNVHWAGKYEK